MTEVQVANLKPNYSASLLSVATYKGRRYEKEVFLLYNDYDNRESVVVIA